MDRITFVLGTCVRCRMDSVPIAKGGLCAQCKKARKILEALKSEDERRKQIRARVLGNVGI